MNEKEQPTKEQPTKRLCPGCGREYEGQLPAFCYSCGTRLGSTEPPPSASPGKSRTRRRGVVALAAVLLLLILVAGGITAAILLIRKNSGEVKLPATAAELKSSLKTCEGFLNEKGKTLAAGRTKGAAVYSVKARLNTTDYSVSGEETVLFTNKTNDNLDKVVFRVYSNDETVRGEGSGATVSNARAGGRETGASLNNSLLSVALPEALRPGAETLLSFSFNESVPEVQGGLTGLEGLLGGKQTGNYGAFGHEKDTYDLGYLMPIVTTYRDGAWEAREVPPFGDASDYDCAYFNVSLDVPDGFRVVATGTRTGASGEGGRRTYAFAAGPVRDFTAQACPTYRVSSRQVGRTKVSSYYFEDSSEGGKKVMEFAANALKQYNNHIGPYPYTNLNVCEAPLANGAGGMEFAGQIQIAKMLYGGSTGAKLPKSLEDLGSDKLSELLNSLSGGLLGDTLEFTVAHEVCHQWWGIVVGSDSIGHPWMDEALTNYCSVLYYRWQHGEEAAKKQLDTQLVMTYSALGLLDGGDAVVDAPVTAFKNQEQYTAIVYAKGALFFNALEKQMGAAAFDKSLKSYYDKNAFLNATPDDLLQAFQSNASDPGAVAALQQRWLKEKHADEDIESSLPAGNLFNDLLKDFQNDTEGLGPLEDLLKRYMNDEGDQSTPSAPVEPNEPTIPI